MQINNVNRKLLLTIMVSALGYFVDVYDIILFAVLRVPSLKALGLSPEEITSVGLDLLNFQLVGMLLGGVVWGMLGDKRGRLSILFGSIILYSLANFANAFVTDVTQYAVLRFLAGFGLAGEFGAGITIVSELMSTQKRGIGTTIITAAGVLGGITGGLVGNLFTWKTAYMIGGGAGFVLLLLRLSLVESTLYLSVKQQKNIAKGSLFAFIKNPQLLKRYIQCLFIGIPFWVFIGIYMTLAPEIGRLLNVQGVITTGFAILFFNIGLGLGEFSSGLYSQWCGSRKKAVFIFQAICFGVLVTFLSLNDITPALFYFFCSLLGFGVGNWAVFMVMSTEQFGTNLRATVTVSLPNMVRGMGVPLTLLITALKPTLGLLMILGLIGGASLILAMISLVFLPETFSRKLDFVET
ncbi:MAG: MFS transporter [Proteobacteria bacterium]|nr:MFS transporter [Pseudomonadota bacterium]